MDTEEIIEMVITREAEVGVEIDNNQIIPEGMIELVVGLNQVQELVLIEIGLDVINVENMITLLKIVQGQKQKRNQRKSNKCTIWMKNKPN